MIEWEERGSGPVVVLIHGVGLDRTMWDRCVPYLLESGYRVVLVDLPGHGRSSRVEEASLGDLSAAVSALPHDSFHLVGFSIGAFVATAVAVSSPERIRSLTLLSAVGRRTEGEGRVVVERLHRATSHFEETMRSTVDRWFSPSWTRRDPELRERVLEQLLNNDRRSYLSCYRVFACSDAEFWADVAQVRAPSLVATGGGDRGSTPEMTTAIAARIPGARTLLVPGARHLLPLEAPAALMPEVLAHLHAADREQRTE